MEKEKVIATYYAGAFDLGIEIFGIEHGIDEYIIYRWTNSSTPKKTRAKIRYTNKGKAYFVSFGKRIPLDECIRV